MLIKYIKSVLWRVAKRLSYTEDAWCLKVNLPQRKTAGSNPCSGKNFHFASMSLAGSDIRPALHPTATPGREAPGP
jgi:hypothetical protein